VAIMDGSVRGVSGNVSAASWTAANTPNSIPKDVGDNTW
jgi:hypothetical protein